LVVFIVFLVWKVSFIKPFGSLSFAKWTAFLSFFTFLYITYYVLVHLPIIDFRPYAIGKNISEGMEWVGEEEPPIHDFYLESAEGENLTELVLAEDKTMLVVAFNLSKSDLEGFSKVKTATDEALKNNYKIYLLSASMNEEFMEIKKNYQLNFDMLFCDETTLKTIIRANPGILTLQNGTVTGKWSWTDAEGIKF